MLNKNRCILYAITDRTWLNGRSLEDVVEQSLMGGVDIIQLREKIILKFVGNLMQMEFILVKVIHHYLKLEKSWARIRLSELLQRLSNKP